MEAMPTLLPGERIDDLQLDGLRIIQQEKGFRFGMDAVLLADFCRGTTKEHVADFGTGTGILPLLLHARGKGGTFEAFEIQPQMAEMARRTMALNGLTEVIRIHERDITQARGVVPDGSLDAIVCNPPYGLSGTTLVNPSGALATARHQPPEGLDNWYRMAYLLLKGKGRFAMVYPAPRMLEAMQSLEKAHMVPKRFRLIYPRVDKPANLVLIEAVKDAKPMLHPEPPLIVYQENGDMTEELKRIYHLL